MATIFPAGDSGTFLLCPVKKWKREKVSKIRKQLNQEKELSSYYYYYIVCLLSVSFLISLF